MEKYTSSQTIITNQFKVHYYLYAFLCVCRGSMTEIRCGICLLRAKFTALLEIPNKILVEKYCTV